MTERSRIVAVPADLNLRETVRGAKLPVMVGPNGVWWSTRTPIGVATLRLDRLAPVEVRGRAWGAGAEWMLDQMPGLLGLRDDLEGFRPEGPAGTLWRRQPFLLSRTDRPWDAIVGAILGQKVQVTRAVQSRRSLARKWGDPAPGPDRPGRQWILPAPDVVAQLAYWDLHRIGVEKARADRLLRAAREMRRLDDLWERPPAEVQQRLKAIRGIGPWTAAMVTAVAFGDPDAVPVGDFHIPNIVAWAMVGEPRATDERMLEILEPYRGHRWRIIRLSKSNGHAPKYGPRLSLIGDGMARGA